MNEEAIQAALEAWNTGVDEFVALLAADVEFHAPPDFPDGDLVQGRDAVRSVLSEMFGSVFTGVEYSLEDSTRGPGGWLLRARQAVDQQRGMKLEWEEFVVIRFDGELISHVWVFYELDAAERQAGLDA
jgi:ketosteroid isomerase-like protein